MAGRSDMSQATMERFLTPQYRKERYRVRGRGPQGAAVRRQQIQTDNGKEFSESFTWHLDDNRHHTPQDKNPLSGGERQGGAKPSHRQRGVLPASPVRFHRPLHETIGAMGKRVQ